MIWRTFLLCVQALWVHAQLTYPIPWWHPKIDTTLRYYPIPLAPANHPSINARCQQIVSRHGPGNHPRDYDDMIKAGTGYAGSNHPNVDRYFPQEAKPNTVISSVGALHPDVDAAYRAGKGYSLASHPSVAAFFQRTPDLLPAGHPNIDTLFSNPAANPLPAWHPELNQFLSYGPSVAITTVSAWHPNVDESYALGKGYSLSYHPSVMTLLNSMALLPNNHPNVDALFSNPAANPLPSWHPKLDGLLTRKAKVRIPLPGSHQNMDIAYRRGQAIPAVHPNVGQVFDGMLPAGHPDLNVLLQDPSAKPLPDWHPSLEAMVTRVNFGNPVAKAAVPADHPNIDSAYAARRPMPNTHPNVAALFSGILPASHPNVDTLLANPSANPLPAWHPTIENHVDRSGTGGADGSAGGVDDDDVGLVQVPAYHPGIDSSYQRGVAAPANHPKVQVLLASIMFLVVPATRNSVLTWFLGIPFDHVILHHRFLGRVTISLATAHGAWYFQELVGQHDNWVEYSNEMIYVTGFFSLFCGWVIAATTTNWFRRHYFNVFFWAHYSFIGFFALSYMHIRQAEPFLLAGIALYGVDKLIRSGSRLVPRRTLVFRNRGDSIAQVRFPKNPFTKLSGVHQVGQYMFVNFPELSLTEWHPFSVSSGPREPFVELHIRALGDHTRKIVALSKQCAKEGRLPLIRSEGPYGRLNFNMRRYGMLYLVGGGVGITPVIGILRDIFLSPPQPHVLKKVVVCWVLQHAKDVDTFLDVLQECTNHAKEFPDVGCFVRSTLIFACGPTRMIEQLWDMSTARNGPNTRVDFHHETFEF
eukprot:g1989.t1